MVDELDLTLHNIVSATHPLAIFGQLPGNSAAQRQAVNRIYRKLAVLIHPDKVADLSQRSRAEEGTKTLNALKAQALDQIKSGTYGTDTITSPATPTTISVSHRRQEYLVSDLVYQGETSNYYQCSFAQATDSRLGLFHVARQPQDNDLMEREAQALGRFQTDTDFPQFHIYTPQLIDSFGYRDSNKVRRQAVIQTLPQEAAHPSQWYSLTEVRRQYPAGVTSADMAWVWRRLLTALGFAHHCGIIHGAVLPDHIWIQPQEHGLILTHWLSSVDVSSGPQPLTAIDLQYRDWYPAEVFDKQPALPGLDLYLGARSMTYLMGGNPITGELPSTIGRKYRAHLRGTAMTNPKSRPQDAWQLQHEFDVLLGTRKHRPFFMPEKSSGGIR